MQMIPKTTMVIAAGWTLFAGLSATALDPPSSPLPASSRQIRETFGAAPLPLAFAGPLRRSMLLETEFLVFTDLWASNEQGLDPLRFRADGTTENRRAGLRGGWRIEDGRLRIEDHTFVYDHAERALFAPLDAERAGNVGWYVFLAPP